METLDQRYHVLSLPVEPPASKPLTLPALRDAAAACRACDLYTTGTQTVFGEGPEHAQVMFVGEEPSEPADIERSRVYVTNAVKHFKWKPQGKRRLHQKPNAAEINACRPWLDAEIAVVKPRILVLLGATAAQALLGRDFRVSLQRGQFIERPGLPLMLATVHPSSILRAPDDETRELEMRAFVQDLKRIAQHLRR